jgi:hypothetical protein
VLPCRADGADDIPPGRCNLTAKAVLVSAFGNHVTGRDPNVASPQIDSADASIRYCAHLPLAHADALVVACRVEVFGSAPMGLSPRPDAREVRAGRQVEQLATTWREVLLSAIQVGRPALRWLALFPDFAEEEFRARVAPLRAYLGLDRSPAGLPVARRSTLYEHGTETTERAAFAYRLGMTMADWLCATQLGIPALTHLKLLPDTHPVRRASAHMYRSPDLVVYRPGRRPAIAIVEAKCGEHLRLRDRQEGAWQLDELRARGALPNYLQVLCGVSIEPHLFLLVDIASSSAPIGDRSWLRDVRRWPGPARWQSLTTMEQFWRRLLTYRILQRAQHLLRVDTMARALPEGVLLLAPGETTPSDRRPPRAPTQILAAQVAGTGISVGLTGRAFVETRDLADALHTALQAQLHLLHGADRELSRNEISSELLTIATGRALAARQYEALLPPDVIQSDDRVPKPPTAARERSSVEVEELVTASQTLERLSDPSMDGRQVQALDASEVYVRLDETWI